MDYLDVIQTCEKALCDYLTSPRTLEEITSQWIIYGKAREPEDFYMLGERNHMEKHIGRPVKKGVVGIENDRYHFRNNL